MSGTYDRNSPEIQQALIKIRQQLEALAKAEKIKDRLGSSFEVRLENNQFEIYAVNSSGGMRGLYTIDPRNFNPEQGLTADDLKQIKTAYAKLEFESNSTIPNTCSPRVTPLSREYAAGLQEKIDANLQMRNHAEEQVIHLAAIRNQEKKAEELRKEKEDEARKTRSKQETIAADMRDGPNSNGESAPRLTPLRG